MNKLLFTVICMMFLIPITAQASSIQLPQSGQTKVNTAADDGDLRTGKPWPNPRFISNGDQTVTDYLTGLVWAKNANLMKNRDPGFDKDGVGGDGTVSWQHALDYILKLNQEKYLGYNDWRLPNLNELASLVNHGQAGAATWLNGQGFAGVQPHSYWSSSTNVLSAGTAWTVSMADGPLNYLKKSRTGNVWPVRSGQSGAVASSGINLPKTGQVACFDSNGATISCTGTGQDGELQIGAAWPQPRFSDNGDQTVIDNLTGLVWTRDANLMITRNPLFDVEDTNSDGAVSWQGALDYVKMLNQDEYLGFSDWRLPNRNELASVMNYVEPNPFAWLNWQGLYNVQNNYWTSTTVASSTGNAWNIDATGTILGEKKSAHRSESYLWPVRSGLPMDEKIDGSTAITPSNTAAGTLQAKSGSSESGSMVLSGTSDAAVLQVTTSSLPDGNFGSTYNAPLVATGGVPPFTWTLISGNLPLGLGLIPTGTFTGYPVNIGNSNFTLQVTDANGAKVSKGYTITVYMVVAVTTTSLPPGTTNTAYNKTLTANAGKQPYTWSINSGTLPMGLSLSATGAITGTPTTIGSSTFNIQVADSNGNKSWQTYTINIYSPISISTTSLPDGSYGNDYRQTLVASGGRPPDAWYVTNGSLPAGLSLDASSGIISGTPTSAGDSSFSIQVKDFNNMTAVGTFNVTINPPVNIITSTQQSSYIGIAYSNILSATGGLPPYTWTISNGSLPNGLILNPSTGVISGTPTAINTSNITIQAQDSNNAIASTVVSLTISDFGSIGGIVSDQISGAPIQGATVTLNLSYKGSNSNDKVYSCNDIPFSFEGYNKVESDDEIKASCYGDYISYFKVRNPLGVPDPFTMQWKGHSAYNGGEYLAQSFKPTKTGSLNRVSFYFSDYSAIYSPSHGGVYVLLKSSLGGQRGIYLAHSAKTTVTPETVAGWVDFDFTSPVIVTAGQEYFLELQGQLPFWEFVSGNIYYDDAEWGNYVQYPDGRSYQRVGGIWEQSVNSLAFRTYVDTNVDITTPLPSQSINMHGTAFYAPYVYLNNVTTNGFDTFDIDNVTYNEFSVNNSANFNFIKTVSSGSNYYDINGWISAIAISSGYETPATNLVTDQFDISFKRTLTTVTNANGTYSFPNLPDGNYYITYEKPAYNMQTAGGALTPGQALTLNTALSLAPPATIMGTVSNNYTTGLISGVNVTVTDFLGTARSAITNSQGQYSIANLVGGAYSITFEHPQYQKQTYTGTASPGQTASLDAKLLPNPPTLTISSPADGTIISSSPLVITGTVSSDATSVTVNGYSANIVNGIYSVSIPIVCGYKNTITATASNLYKGTASLSIAVTYNASGNISGLVTDAVTTRPLPSVQVAAMYYSTGKSVRTVTGSDGRYSLNNLYDDEIYLTINKPGYRSYETVLKIINGQARILNASLSPILPVISGVSSTTPAADRAVITWTTDQQASSVVDYGTTIAYGSTQSDAILSTNHNITITSLSPGVTYHYRISSTNTYGITSSSGDFTFTTPGFTVKNLGDTGNVTVMEAAGNYDAKNPDGSVNDQPRKSIATEYFKTHGDTDFLVFLSTFDYALPESGTEGFYLGIKNDVKGINQPIFDNSAQFGSAGKLQGTIDLGNVSSLASNMYGPKLDEKLTTLNHELMHRFGTYVRFKNPDGTLNTGLLGKDSAHWSYLLDSKGSLMYGNGWNDNKDGTFTATATRSAFSPLDLYLMGMIPKEQVPPMLLIDNPVIDKTQLPHLGDTITGTAKTVTIQDIIATEGERVPNSTIAQKQFNVGFVLLTRPGDNAAAAAQAIETLRKAWAGRFAELTQGKGSVANIPASFEIAIDSPVHSATITGPDVTVSGTVINTSGAEAGVTVNGMPATITGNRFIVNHVPLQSGVSSLIIAATDANGLTTSATRNVTANTGNYIRISSNIESGTGPLEVNLRIDTSFVITAPVVNVTGPGGAASLTPVSETEYTAKFTSEGTYTVTASAVGPDGQVYADTVTITVMSRYQLETLLKGKWEGMRQKIAAGDIQGAGAYFPLATRDRYQAIFNDPSMEIMSRLNEISDIKIYTIMDDIVSGGAIKQEDDGKYSYPLDYIRDENGIWRIYGF